MRDEWTRILVPVGDPALDGGGQIGHAAVGAARQPFRGQIREPTLDEVHPGAVGRSEVERESRMALEPALDLGGAVSRSQVGDHVAQGDVERGVEIGGPVTQIAVGLTSRHAGQHRPSRRGAIERLDLGFLVHSEHDRTLFKPGAGASGGLK